MSSVFSAPEPEPLPEPINEESGKTVARREKRRARAGKVRTLLSPQTGGSGLKTTLGG